MPAILASPYLAPALMLVGSNIFMTAAWYWHLSRCNGITPSASR